MGQSQQSRQIYITIEAGQTQSLELFDFNSSQNRAITNQVNQGQSYIVHHGESIVYQVQPNPLTVLFTMKISEESLQFTSQTPQRHTLWRVLAQGQAYPVAVGSILKIGKVKLRLKQIVEEQKQVTSNDFKSRSIYHQNLEDLKSCSNYSRVSQGKQCRICFDGSDNCENPLVCLCKCSGTVKYIHHLCLKDWINNKIERRQHHNTLCFYYEQIKCQICQEYYQPQFNYQGRKYMLLNLQNAPSVPYAVFEEAQIETQNRRLSMFLVGLGEEDITIGRNSNSTIVMKEISVSRNHCELTYKNRILYIKDKGSKFGTLIKATDEIEFNPLEGVSLQFESKLIKIQERRNIGCCCVESDTFRLKFTNHDEDSFQIL